MSPLLDDLAIPLTEREADRRRFLGLLGASALSVAGIGTAITGVRYMEPDVFFVEDSRFAVGRPGDVPLGTVVAVPKYKVYVVHAEPGFIALSAVCTHLGCMTRYVAAEQRIECPCHGSRFDRQGNVTGGPAPKPLRRVAIALENGLLVVNPLQRVADDFVLEVT